MTTATDLAIKCGIAYFLTPENTTEMHGSDRQIEVFADALRAAERERLALLAETRADGWHSLTPDEIRKGTLDAINAAMR